MVKKVIFLVMAMSSFCFVLNAAPVEKIVPADFLEELMAEKVVSVIHDEEDETLSLVPECAFRDKLVERRIEKKDSPYTAEFLYIISKQELMEYGKRNLSEITVADISEIFTGLSRMSGMRYRFSETNAKGTVLYKKVSTIDELEKGKEIPDMISRNCDGMKIFCYQHDRLLGNLKFLLSYEMKDNELYLSILNENNLGLFGFNACKKENLRINIQVTDCGDDILFYIAADANYENVLRMFSIRKIIKKLMNERLDAIYHWFFSQF